MVVVYLLEIAFLRFPAFRNDWRIGRWFGKSRYKLLGDTPIRESSNKQRLLQMDLDHGRLHPEYLNEQDQK
ncbi:MAG: hypothetical protein OER77_12495 [Myxococcales bacterium]|nr:hypothetical protein [Myxococcales bacterium]